VLDCGTPPQPTTAPFPQPTTAPINPSPPSPPPPSLPQWASDLGSKAQQALSGLQRSIQSFPETTADAAAPAQNGATPATTAEADIAATISKLEGVSAAIRDSNTAFETAFPSADGGAAAAVVAEAAEGVEDRVKERQEYLQGLVGDMEAAEEALVKEAAAKQEAATEALAAAASVVAAAASEAAAEVEEAVEEAVAGAEAAVAAAEPAKASGEGVEVEIAVRCETQPGQDVWVVGSIPALGSWDLDGALALAWTVRAGCGGRGGGLLVALGGLCVGGWRGPGSRLLMSCLSEIQQPCVPALPFIQPQRPQPPHPPDRRRATSGAPPSPSTPPPPPTSSTRRCSSAATPPPSGRAATTRAATWRRGAPRWSCTTSSPTEEREVLTVMPMVLNEASGSARGEGSKGVRERAVRSVRCDNIYKLAAHAQRSALAKRAVASCLKITELAGTASLLEALCHPQAAVCGALCLSLCDPLFSSTVSLHNGCASPSSAANPF